MSDDAHPLLGRTALVTGVSRRKGIGFAVARKLATLGASIVVHHYAPHDEQQPWGGDDLDAVRGELEAALHPSARFADIGADLGDPEQPQAVIDRALQLTGALDVLVCNQARSGGDGGILDMTAERLDGHWAVDARATLLLTAAFARSRADAGEPARRPGDRPERVAFDAPTGRVFWMTSGQGHGPMRGEVAYASAKAALAGVTRTVAAELLDLGIVLNTINPGPVDTGYLDPATTDRDLTETLQYIADSPFGRFGRPSDPAELIGWLATDRGAWVVGQVLTSDGGFSLG